MIHVKILGLVRAHECGEDCIEDVRRFVKQCDMTDEEYEKFKIRLANPDIVIIESRKQWELAKFKAKAHVSKHIQGPQEERIFRNEEKRIKLQMLYAENLVREWGICPPSWTGYAQCAKCAWVPMEADYQGGDVSSCPWCYTGLFRVREYG